MMTLPKKTTEKFARDDTRAKAIGDLIMEMMALDDRPFTLVKYRGFSCLINHKPAYFCSLVSYFQVFYWYRYWPLEAESYRYWLLCIPNITCCTQDSFGALQKLRA